MASRHTKKTLIIVSSCGSAQPVTITTHRATVTKPKFLQPQHDWRRFSRSADCLLFICPQDIKVVEKVFFYLLEVSVVNSYLPYKQTISQPRSHLCYRRAIVEQAATLFIQQAPPKMGPGAPQRTPNHHVPQQLDAKPHFLGKSPTG